MASSHNVIIFRLQDCASWSPRSIPDKFGMAKLKGLPKRGLAGGLPEVPDRDIAIAVYLISVY